MTKYYLYHLRGGQPRWNTGITKEEYEKLPFEKQQNYVPVSD